MEIDYWNYRIIQQDYKGTNYMRIHEVYYVEGKPSSWTEDPICAFGEDLEDVIKNYRKMSEAFEMPILEIVVGEMDNSLRELKK